LSKRGWTGSRPYNEQETLYIERERLDIEQERLDREQTIQRAGDAIH
jgi:hypothetical protein